MKLSRHEKKTLCSAVEVIGDIIEKFSDIADESCDARQPISLGSPQILQQGWTLYNVFNTTHSVIGWVMKHKYGTTLYSHNDFSYGGLDHRGSSRRASVKFIGQCRSDVSESIYDGVDDFPARVDELIQRLN